MPDNLTTDAALLLRRIIVAPSSELESVHTATDRMTELVDELRARKLVILQGGKWVVTPPGTDTWTAPRAVARLRAVLVDGAEDAESTALLASWGVPLTVPFARASDAWMARIYAVPERHFKVHDVLRLAPDAGMCGERTPADEVLHWITEGLLAAGQITVHSARDGIYTFPEPAAEDLDDALVELRAGRYVHPRIETELVMRGDAERLLDGTVVPVAHGSPAPVTETPETKPVETPKSEPAKSGVPSKPDTETPPPAPSKTKAVATREDAPAPPAKDTALLASMDGNIRQLVQLHTLSQSSAREALQGANRLHAVLFRVMAVTQKKGAMNRRALSSGAFSKPEDREHLPAALEYGVTTGALTRTGVMHGATYVTADPTRVGVTWAELNDAAARVKTRPRRPVVGTGK